MDDGDVPREEEEGKGAGGGRGGGGRPALTLDVDDGKADDTFHVDGDVFIKDNIAINPTGVLMKDNPKAFTVRSSPSGRARGLRD